MAYVETHDGLTRSEVLRWTSCAVAVLMAHALAVLAIGLRPDYEETDAGAPVVMIDLAPVPVAPTMPDSDLAPGPQQLQAESQERAREEKHEEKPLELERVPELTPAPDPAVTLPTPPPEPSKQPDKAQQEPTEAAPVPTAPPSIVAPAPRPASPPPGHVPRSTPAAMVSWQRSLVSQLERHKRYPPRAHGEHGVARLAFRIDRNGRVLSSRIVQSSGSAILDDETLSLVQRAQPLPAPPADIADDQLSFVVPIRYAVSARR